MVLRHFLGRQLSWLEHGPFKPGVEGSSPSRLTTVVDEHKKNPIVLQSKGLGFSRLTEFMRKWAVSSVGQSASLTQTRSQVRLLYRPPPCKSSFEGWFFVRFLAGRQDLVRQCGGSGARRNRRCGGWRRRGRGGQRREQTGRRASPSTCEDDALARNGGGV